MKKLLTLLLVTATVSLGAFARGATWNFTLGATMPYSQLDYTDTNATVEQLNYGGQGAVTWIGNSGFTLRSSFAAGVATSKGMTVSGTETQGAFQNLSLGLGVSPVNKNNVFLGFTGMLGLELSEYTVITSETDSSAVDHTYTDARILTTFSVGADLYAGVRLTKHLGLYADVAGRYVLAGGDGTARNDSYKETDGTIVSRTLPQADPAGIKGKFLVQPSVGLVWTLR